MEWEYEKAEKLFIDQLGGQLINVDNYGFSREFQFEVLGVVYTVEWYHNQSTLISSDGLRVMFHHAKLSNTWTSPAKAKMKLQFRDVRCETVAVLVTEYRK